MMVFLEVGLTLLSTSPKTATRGVIRDEKQSKIKKPKPRLLLPALCFATEPYSGVKLLLLNQDSFIHIVVSYSHQLGYKIILQTKLRVLYTN